MTCKNWCETSENSWSTKCDWKNCNGCSKCNNQLFKEFGDGFGDITKCANFCKENDPNAEFDPQDSSKANKCLFKGCMGCNECSTYDPCLDEEFAGNNYRACCADGGYRKDGRTEQCISVGRDSKTRYTEASKIDSTYMENQLRLAAILDSRNKI